MSMFDMSVRATATNTSVFAMQPWQPPPRPNRVSVGGQAGDEDEEESRWAPFWRLIAQGVAYAKSVDSVRWALFVFAAFLVFWVVMVSALLIVAAVEYLTNVVERERQDYTVTCAMVWARAEASRLLVASHHAREALRVALRGGLLLGSWDLATLEQVLAPVFATTPHVRSVDLLFADAPAEVLSVMHDGGGDGGLRIWMRSNAADCYLLGPQGCLDDPPPAVAPTWALESLRLGTGRVSSDVAVSLTNDSRTLELEGDAYAWGRGVQLVLEKGSGDAWANRTWFPSYRLLFKLIDVGRGEGFSLLGRISLEVGALIGPRLQDGFLGEEGRILLCDREGAVLASGSPWDVLTLSGENSSVPLTRSLGDAAGLPADVRSAAISAIAGGVDASASLDDGSFFAVGFLPEPMRHFAVVVYAPSREPFIYDRMKETSIACIVFACMPYLAALVLPLALLRSGQRRGEDQEEDEEGDTPDSSPQQYRFGIVKAD